MSRALSGESAMTRTHLLLCGLGLLLTTGNAGAQAPEWAGFAKDSQHTATVAAAAQPLMRKHWVARVDLQPVLSGDELLIHYASPMITASNTVLLPVKTTASGNFRIEALRGADGSEVWRRKSSYVPPPHGWYPEFPAGMTPGNRLYFAEAGGGVAFRDQPDMPSGTSGVFYFYGRKKHDADPAVYDSSVYVSTPITSDASGNIYFGFTVTGNTPAKLQSGLARISADGMASTWVAASVAAEDDTINHVAMNSAPAISADGSTVYVAVSDGFSGYLLGVDTTKLATKDRIALKDPSSGAAAWIDDDSTASPMIGPDGDVYYGVLEDPFPAHDDRGWLLHFDATLTVAKTPGSFGWDSTPSLVPASAVPSYTGKSAYLLMSKYNNYYQLGPNGDGHNRIAILDPFGTEPDPYIPAVTVMSEVETVLNPHHPPGETAGSVYEWCIDSAAVDPSTNSVIANAEDGHVYRWDLATGALSEVLRLNGPRPEAYTPTLVGPDGTVYAINDSRLYALGD